MNTMYNIRSKPACVPYQEQILKATLIFAMLMYHMIYLLAERYAALQRNTNSNAQEKDPVYYNQIEMTNYDKKDRKK